MISMFNTGYDLQNQLDGVKNGIAIVATNNTHIAITSGQYVYIQDNSTLAEGLYRATANIAANGTLSGSNVTAVSGGGLNALNSKIDNKLFKKLTATTDFNSISDDGIYLVDWVSNGTTYNRPVNQGGRLEHSTSTTGNQPTKQQTFITYAGKVYVRGYSNDSWTAWEELSFSSTIVNQFDVCKMLALNFGNGSNPSITFTLFAVLIIGRPSEGKGEIVLFGPSGAFVIAGTDSSISWTLSNNNMTITLSNSITTYRQGVFIYK